MLRLSVRSIFQVLCILAMMVGTASPGFAADEAVSHPAEAGDHAAEGGVPITFTRDLALWSLIVFVLFLFVLKKFAWAPMIEGLDKREAGIRKSISDAEDGRRKAQALLADYEQKLKNAEQTVQAMVAEARRDAERTTQDLIAGAQKEMQAIRNRAKDDIQQAKDSALADVFSSVNDQVIRATELVLGRTMTESDQDRLVTEALAGIGR